MPLSRIESSSIKDGEIVQADINTEYDDLITRGNPNLIINGDMQVSQRGQVFSVPNVITYTLDRWACAAAGANVQITASVDASPPYLNYMGITGAAGNTLVTIRQRIESYTIKPLAGQDVTVSFVCYNETSAISSASVLLVYAGAPNDWSSGVTFSSQQSIDMGNTGVQSFTFSLPLAAANGVELYIAFDNHTSGVAVLTNVKLEQGSVATPWFYEDIGTTLAKCQRYYEKSYDMGISPGSLTADGSVAMRSSSVASPQYIQIRFTAAKRGQPTVTLYNGVTGATGTWRGSSSTDYPVSAVHRGESGFCVNVGSATGQFYQLGHWVADAEL